MAVPPDPPSRWPTIIIGAGPAGLSAAYELVRHGQKCLVLEASDSPGGLARTVEYNGYRFDIGGHRFFTKVSVVNRMWQEILGDDLLTRPRMSRIYFRSQFFRYPLEPVDALSRLGIVESIRSVASFAKARLFPRSPADDLESWLINNFGERLYLMFFKTYTEKVWGVPCGSLRAEWAAQRIRGLSMLSLIRNALTPQSMRGDSPKTLIDQFHYPRLGPGQMWMRTAEFISRNGGTVLYNHPVDRILRENGRIVSVHAAGRAFHADNFIASMPVRDLVESLEPRPSDDVAAAAGLQYRDFVTVALIVQGRDLFPDNWIYIHDSSFKAGRVQNYKNWSPDMVPHPETSCLGFEYFCNEGDALWSMTDAGLTQLASLELDRLNLGRPAAVLDSKVVRVRKAYPVYDEAYAQHLQAVRRFLSQTANIQLIGRNGMHRYNNQDHSMLTGLLAARNVLGLGAFDLWQVNADEEYHEDGFALSHKEIVLLDATQPQVPSKLAGGL
jgi:protoporphyrinogen oxidase